MTDREARPAQILLVEDNPGDVDLTRMALHEARVRNQLHVARDGEEALAYLRCAEPAADQPRPDLVLLDLNLPKMNGIEVLEQIKQDPALRRIPVVMLTTSSAEQDIVRSYDQHVNAYVTKPVLFADFIEALRSVEGFWLEIVRLPEANGRP